MSVYNAVVHPIPFRDPIERESGKYVDAAEKIGQTYAVEPHACITRKALHATDICGMISMMPEVSHCSARIKEHSPESMVTLIAILTFADLQLKTDYKHKLHKKPIDFSNFDCQSINTKTTISDPLSHSLAECISSNHINHSENYSQSD